MSIDGGNKFKLGLFGAISPAATSSCGMCAGGPSPMAAYADELPYLRDEVLPRLARAGLREIA